jgi:hypothetical protein
MVYSTTFLSLLLATTAIALPLPDNEGVGHGVGARLQVTSTGRNSSALHEAKLDAQLEIQDTLARTQSVGSAATIPGEATIFGKHIPEPSVLSEAQNRCAGKGSRNNCSPCKYKFPGTYDGVVLPQYGYHYKGRLEGEYAHSDHAGKDACEVTDFNSRCNKCSGANLCPCAPLFTDVGCYVDDQTRMWKEPPVTLANSVGECETYCSGYTYFGVQYGNECFCGNTLPASGSTYTKVNPTSCNKPCPSADDTYLGLTCGGSWRMSIYKSSKPEITCAAGKVLARGKCFDKCSTAMNTFCANIGCNKYEKNLATCPKTCGQCISS